jgi:hypothetical protein
MLSSAGSPLQLTSLLAFHAQQHRQTRQCAAAARRDRPAVDCAAAASRQDTGDAAPQLEQRRSSRAQPTVLTNYPFTLHQLVIFSVRI